MQKSIRTIQAEPTQPKRLRVAAYARVSCDKDSMLHSLAEQVSKYSRMIQSNTAWEYAGVYADEGITGTKEDRPEFQRLLADCRAGKIDMIITKSISRFARNTVTLLKTVRELSFWELTFSSKRTRSTVFRPKERSCLPFFLPMPRLKAIRQARTKSGAFVSHFRTARL